MTNPTILVKVSKNIFNTIKIGGNV